MPRFRLVAGPKLIRNMDQELLNRRKDIYRPEETERAWSDAADVVKVYSDDMIKRWNDEIDTYLVYVRGRTCESQLEDSTESYQR